MLAGILHTEVVIVEPGMHLIIVKIESCVCMGGAKALTAFSGAPHKPGTIYTANASEANAMKKRGTLNFRIVIIVRELDFAQQVETKQRKKYNPQSKERFTVEEAPTVS